MLSPFVVAGGKGIVGKVSFDVSAGTDGKVSLAFPKVMDQSALNVVTLAGTNRPGRWGAGSPDLPPPATTYPARHRIWKSCWMNPRRCSAATGRGTEMPAPDWPPCSGSTSRPRARARIRPPSPRERPSPARQAPPSSCPYASFPFVREPCLPNFQASVSCTLRLSRGRATPRPRGNEALPGRDALVASASRSAAASCGPPVRSCLLFADTCKAPPRNPRTGLTGPCGMDRMASMKFEETIQDAYRRAP